jgi:predicted ATPase
LHVIYGANGIGKSYAVKAVYCLFKSLLNFSGNPYFLLQVAAIEHEKNLALFSNLKSKIRDSNGKVVPITKDCVSILSIVLNNTLAKDFRRILSHTFASIETLRNQLTKNPLEINLVHESFLIKFQETGKGNLEIIELKLPFSILAQLSESDYYTYQIMQGQEPSMGGGGPEDVFGRDLLRIILHRFFLHIAGSRIGDLHFLPASRSGLYESLNSLPLIITQLSQQGSELERGSSIPNLTTPVSDYFVALGNMDVTQKNEDLSSLANQIEAEILSGEVDFEDINRRIKYTPKNSDMRLEMSETSSLVAELSPLVLFLRHIVRTSNDVLSERHQTSKSNVSPLLFIEEPEAHLHPEVQTKLMEVFAELSKLGIKLIITTHSDYMFHKLSNLLIAGKVEPERTAVYLMEMVDGKGSIVKNDMEATKDGIEDHNFIETSERLYNERIKEYEKQNGQ